MAVIKGGILGGLVLFLWGMFSWMVLPWHMETLHKFKNEQVVASAVLNNVSEPGVYFLPHAFEQQKHLRIFTSIDAEAMPSSSMAIPMAIGLLTQIIGAFLVAWLLSKTRGLNYFTRVGFVVVFALAAGVITAVPYWNWFGFDSNFTLVGMADLLISWLLAGLIIAKVVRG